MSVKTPTEIELMRIGGRKLAEVLRVLVDLVEPGMSTKQIADRAAAEMKQRDLQAILQGFQGYSDVMCASLNDEVVHGIPSSKRVIKQGDLVKFDVTAAYKGLIVDTAKTIYIGELSSAPKDIQKLIKGTKQSLEAGIDAIKGEGTRIGDIAEAVQGVLEKYDLGIVRDLVGHGVGHNVWEPPNVPNYGLKGTGPALPAGATIAIEPMATLGGWQVDILKDGWTVATRDHSLSAHFEHTVLVTERGSEILTAP